MLSVLTERVYPGSSFMDKLARMEDLYPCTSCARTSFVRLSSINVLAASAPNTDVMAASRLGLVCLLEMGPLSVLRLRLVHCPRL